MEILTDTQNAFGSFRCSLSKRSIAAVIAIFFMLAMSLPVCAQEQYLEYAVKATYLYKFEPFIDWPAGTFATNESPLVICIAGRDPFGDVIDRTVANVTLGARHVVVRRLQRNDNDPACHIVFIDGSTAVVKKWLTMMKDKPVLTVTERDPGEADTGIINFVTVNEHVRFAIDSAAAARSGLVLSTKLLSLATIVKTASNEEQR